MNRRGKALLGGGSGGAGRSGVDRRGQGTEARSGGGREAYVARVIES
ncbi:hypothetical protein [Brevibacillus agri]|nr:hypothetical protein [Brevibacillus agri]